MSEYHTSLIILKKELSNKELVHALNSKLNELNYNIEKENGLVVFNNGTLNEERDEFYFDETFSDQVILNKILEWKYLGIIDFSSFNSEIILSVNFKPYFSSSVSFIDIGIFESLIKNKEIEREYQRFLVEFTKKMNGSRCLYSIPEFNPSQDLKFIHSELDKYSLDFDFLNS